MFAGAEQTSLKWWMWKQLPLKSIVDEALAVGDGYFQKKSVDRITDFHRRGGTLLFCSHALYYVALLCDQALWLKKGQVAGQGPTLPVVRAYEAFLQERERSLAHAPGPAASAGGTEGRKPARLTEVLVHDGELFDAMLVQDLLGRLVDALTLAGELELLLAPIDEQRLEMSLHRARLLADRGLGDGIELGRLGETPRLHQVGEHLENVDLHKPLADYLLHNQN